MGAHVDLLTAACANPKDRNLRTGLSWIKRYVSEISIDHAGGVKP